MKKSVSGSTANASFRISLPKAQPSVKDAPITEPAIIAFVDFSYQFTPLLDYSDKVCKIELIFRQYSKSIVRTPFSLRHRAMLHSVVPYE